MTTSISLEAPSPPRALLVVVVAVLGAAVGVIVGLVLVTTFVCATERGNPDNGVHMCPFDPSLDLPEVTNAR